MNLQETNGIPEGISDDAGQRLCRLARSTITSHITGEQLNPELSADLVDMEPRGVFVTIRKQGKLRGCIGTFQPRGTLIETIGEIAIAATRDPRFIATPLGQSEFPDIRVELSILSPLKSISDPLDFERGVHGILLEHGLARGCFLPDVGMDAGWDKETFLSELCRQKANLHAGAWRDAEANIFTFTIQKFAA